MTNKGELVDKNSEILFLYDAKKCNPNGDIDNENRPRMDIEKNTNLVSDVRLKRYIRDYLLQKGHDLFVTEEAETAKARVTQILDRKVTKKKPITNEELNKIVEKCKDISFFGAVMATEGGNDHLVGPVQFNWGYSLNEVELQESKTITSSFSSGEGIGKDYRVNYSFLAFHGAINALVGKKVGLKYEDLDLLDEAMIKSIPANRTRSKIGQTPRVYIRILLKNQETYLKDLREYITLSETKGLRNINEVEIDFSNLKSYLERNKDKIEKIIYWKDDNLRIKGWLNKKILPLEEISN